MALTPQLLNRLIETLTSKGIVYCHWKSNLYLRDGWAKGRDLDLLVARQDARQFENVLMSLGFKQVTDPLQVRSPSVKHYYGLDHTTDELVHLHVFNRVITGESLIKNHCFPLEDLLLSDLRSVEGVPAPARAAELMLFVIRVMLKQRTIVEYFLLRQRNRSGYENVRRELDSLLVDGSAAQCIELLHKWLPTVDDKLFRQCIDSLRENRSALHRYWLAVQLGRQLKMYERHSFIPATTSRIRIVLNLIWRRLRHAGKSKRFASGGRLIAFVGPEATGKSTLVKETVSWLGRSLDVSSAHLGKPPSTWLTFLPNLALPFLRHLVPQHRISVTARAADRPDACGASLPVSLRAVFIAWDRRALATKLRRRAVNGGIVVCDRYPSAILGAMDSARLEVPSGTGWRSKLLGYLAKLESRLYRQIPPPDVVIRLTVPVEVAVARNQGRQAKREADDYVLSRHTAGLVPSFPTARTIELDTSQTLPQTIHCARRIVWDVL